MPVRLGLNGFGRIGRNLFRLLHRAEDVEIAAVADVADPEALTYLLRYDTILGRFPGEVFYRDGALYCHGRETPFLSDASGQVDWAAHHVDYVVEAVGRPRGEEALSSHLERGAKRVILCVPPEDGAEITVVYGVNHEKIDPDDRVISNGSCTAHSAAPLLDVLDKAFGIEWAHLSVVHAFTREQRLADVPGGSMRLSRAAGENIVPSETNVAHVLEQVLPRLEGRLSASALRVPVANGSIVDATVSFRDEVSAQRINDVVRTAASGPYRGLLEYNEDPIVSSDVAQSTFTSIFDADATMVKEGRLAKLISWFDNSWGYSHRAVDLARHLGRLDGLDRLDEERQGGAA